MKVPLLRPVVPPHVFCLLADGVTGRMVAIVDGKYAHAPLPDPALGARRVDLTTQYNVERFRPQYANRLGEPVLLSAQLGAPVAS